jgi:type VII secretion integral membrane protein EccD
MGGVSMMQALSSRGGTAPAEVCHISVQGLRKRVDLALPTTVPILELTPVLAALCLPANGRSGQAKGQSDTQDHGTPPAWSLTRGGHAPFELSSTLAEQGVLDGEVLHLVDVSTWRAPVVSDVVDAVTGALEEDGLRWPGEAARRVLAGLCAGCLLGAAAVAAGAGVFDGPGGLLPLLLAAGLTLVAAAPGVIPEGPTRLALATSAVALSAAGAWGLAGDPGGAAGVTAPAIAATICLLAVSTAIPAIAPGGVLVAAVVACGAVVVARGVPVASVAAVVVVSGTIALRTWPPLVSRALSALAAPGAVQAEALARRSRRLLASLSAGTAVVMMAAALTLGTDGGGFALCLALVGGAALVLRSRTYRFVPEALPPALAAGVGLVVLEVLVAWRYLVPAGAGPLAVSLLVGNGLILAGLSTLALRPTNPGRGVRVAWLAVDVAIGPLALGTLGVYGLLGQLAHHFIH